MTAKMKKICHHQLPIPIRAHLASAMSNDVDAATVAENKRLKMMLDQVQGALKRKEEELKQKDKTIDDQRDELKQKVKTIDDQRDELKQKDSQLNFSRWLMLTDIQPIMQASTDLMSYCDAMKSFRTIFNDFTPPSADCRIANSGRTTVEIRTGLLDTALFERAHGWPLDPACSRTWEPLLEPLLREVQGRDLKSLIQMTVHGFKYGRGKRENHAGLINNRFNFLAVGKQFMLLDLLQVLGWIVLTL